MMRVLKRKMKMETMEERDGRVPRLLLASKIKRQRKRRRV